MVESLINKVLFILFFMSFFNILRHIWKIFSIVRDQDIPNKYELTKQELIFLGLSLAYVFTTFFTKITL
jgi:hypothetical protein